MGDVGTAATAVLTKAMQMGFLAQVLTTHLQGEAREVGKFAAALACDAAPGHCLILGGETTVTVQGQGRGGRNLEVALAAAIALQGCPNRVIITLATDGEDGTTGMAGAIISGETAIWAQEYGLEAREFLRNNDSYSFFEQLDEHLRERYSPSRMEAMADRESDDTVLPLRLPHLIQTGPTGTNVNDLIVILAY